MIVKFAAVTGIMFALLASSGCTPPGAATLLWSARLEGEPPRGIAFADHEAAIVVAGGNFHAMLQGPEPGWATVFERQTGRIRGHLTGQEDGLCSVADAGPGGVATAGFDGTLRFYDAGAPGPPTHTVPMKIGAILSMAISPDHRLLALGGASGGQEHVSDVIVIYDLRQMKELTRWGTGQEMVTALAFTPDSKTLLFAAQDGATRIWDMKANHASAAFSPAGLPAAAWPEAIAVSPDGNTAAIVRNPLQRPPVGGTVELWDLPSRELRQILHFENRVHAASFSLDGRLLATGSGESVPAKIWQVNHGWSPAGILTDDQAVEALVFSHDGHYLALASEGRLSLWKLEAATTNAAPRRPWATSTRATRELDNATTDEERFYALNAVAKESFTAGKVEVARKYAGELLARAGKFKGNWNYGNAIHDGNAVLGRIALREGRLEEAKQYLLEAGKSPGSPQMDSFGPNMSLAKDLLEKGEREAVLQYFELCRKFWKMGQEKLDQWSKDVKAGRNPDFGANLVY